MQYSFFLLFSVLAVAIFYLVPGKIRLAVLLSENVLFYALLTDRVSFWAVPLVCFISWLGGRLLGRYRERAALAKVILALTVGFDLLFMIVGRLHLSILQQPLSVVGLAFFGLEAISYLIDVYRGEIPAGSLIMTAAYISFFPTIISGPIERAGNLFPQFKTIVSAQRREVVSLQRFYESLILILYSVFLKFVLADRLGILVDYVFSEHWHLGSTGLILGAVAYGFQLYCDFAGYSYLAIGIARAMGIEVMDNFRAPYLCADIHQFWNGWHVSLSGWLRDYVYIPLGGNRKGQVRKYVNLMVTFLVSAIWHGSGVTFLLWGGLHGLYQIFADLWVRGRKALCSRRKKEADNCRSTTGTGAGRGAVDSRPFGGRFLRGIFTFSLVDFAWILFRSPDLTTAADYCKGIFTRMDWYQLFNGTIFQYGLTPTEVMLLLPAFLLLLFCDLLMIRKNSRLDQWLNGQPAVFQILLLLFLFGYSLIFGIYGPGYSTGQFIYAQF